MHGICYIILLFSVFKILHDEVIFIYLFGKKPPGAVTGLTAFWSPAGRLNQISGLGASGLASALPRPLQINAPYLRSLLPGDV